MHVGTTLLIVWLSRNIVGFKPFVVIRNEVSWVGGCHRFLPNRSGEGNRDVRGCSYCSMSQSSKNSYLQSSATATSKTKPRKLDE